MAADAVINVLKGGENKNQKHIIDVIPVFGFKMGD